MSAEICSRCGRPLTPDTPRAADSLADLSGPEQPPEAAGWIAGATLFDAEVGTNSGPTEYDDEPGLCETCRTERSAQGSSGCGEQGQ
jgi:hypothetical protein